MDTEHSFTRETTRPLAHLAATMVGHSDADVECLRIGENAIYRIVGTPLVARIARSLRTLGDVRKEVRVARWLEQSEVPAVRLAEAIADQPLVIAERHPVTFWQFIDTAEPEPHLGELGRLLRLVHNLEPPEWLELPTFSPFGRVSDRLRRAPANVDPDDLTLLRDLSDRLTSQYEHLEFVFPPSPVHGDAHLFNLLRDRSGQALLLDFEAFSYGHREWDLTVTGNLRRGFDQLDAAEYAAFTDAYGYDILEWPGFETLRSIRELTMTTWLMQLIDDPRAEQEFRRRIGDLRSGQFPRRWTGF